jgi:hypothetical protein
MISRLSTVFASCISVGLLPICCFGQGTCPLTLDINADGEIGFGDMVEATSLNDLLALHQCLDIPRGDVDGNRLVAFQDLLEISNHYHPARPQVGQPRGYADADLNLDQIVDFADYAIMHTNFTQTSYVPDDHPLPSGMLHFNVDRQNRNRLVLWGDGLKLGGIEVVAPGNGIVHASREIRIAEPFILALEYSPEMFTAVNAYDEFGPVGTVIDGPVPTYLEFRDGYDFAGATLRWFEVGSHTIHSISLPEPSGARLFIVFGACIAGFLSQCRASRIRRA